MDLHKRGMHNFAKIEHRTLLLTRFDIIKLNPINGPASPIHFDPTSSVDILPPARTAEETPRTVSRPVPDTGSTTKSKEAHDTFAYGKSMVMTMA
jgi:hypothetical protein